MGWEPLRVIATNTTSDVTWTSDVNEVGNFEIALPSGEWDISLLESAFEHTTTTTEPDTTIELTIFPDNSTLNLFAFIDSSRDGNATNGTGVIADFRVVPLGQSGIQENFTTQATGIASVQLEPGNYLIETSILNPGETLHGTRILTGSTNIQIPLEATTLHRDIGFDPEGVVNITFIDQLLAPVADLEVKFRNVDREPVIVTSLSTDDDGNILALLPEGRTIIEIDGYEPGDETVLGARSTIDVIAGDQSSPIMVELTEMATLNLTISDSETSDGIPDQKIILQSLDGLGTIKMPATSETGFLSLIHI